MRVIDKDFVADILGELILKYPTMTKADKIAFGIGFQEAIWIIMNNQIK